MTSSFSLWPRRRPVSMLGMLVVAALASACTGTIGDGGDDVGKDGKPICNAGPTYVKSSARRLSVAEYENVIHGVFGEGIAPSSKYPGIYGKSATGFSTEPALYDVGDQSVESLMLSAEEVAEEVAGALPTLLPCSTAGDAGDACVDQFVDDFVERAYRRPVEADERAALHETYQGGRDSGASFTEAMAMVTAHALQSPQFLYLVEPAGNDGRELTGYEIASRLSFYFWGSLPDDELLGVASSDALKDPEVRRQQAQRMLADARAEPVLRRFFREWTQTEDVAPGDKDPALLPGFDADYAASMAESFDRFGVEQARKGTLDTLLTGKSVWVDAHMASFYGLPAASDWTEVTLDERQSGLVTQPLFLASAAHYGDTSYVFRGRFVRKRLLCQELGAPPGDAQKKFEDIPKPPDPTGKDLSAGVTADGNCASCHSQMDPAGLSLEGFGALGQYREDYPSGKSIDPSGTLIGVGDGDLAFSSYPDLFAALSKEPEVAQCFGTQIFRFAMSRSETEDDACAVENIGKVLQTEGATLADVLVEMAVSDSFGYRHD